MNLLVINKSKKTVRVFEPNGLTYWTEAVEETVKTYENVELECRMQNVECRM